MKKRLHHANGSSTWFPYFILLCGLLLIGVWAAHRYVYTASISLPDRLLTYYSLHSNPGFRPQYIDIPSIAQLTVVEAGKVNNIWTVSNVAANHVRLSAVPGSEGNIIIYGHNTRAIFGKLTTIPIGEIITIVTQNGQAHTYRVTTTDEVDPSQTDLLKPTMTETLTIYTCSGWFDSKRFVVRAVPTI